MAAKTIDDEVMQEALRLIGRNDATWRREFVVASAINADPVYQRAISQQWVREIAMNFDTFLASGIKVSRRADGSLWVIDGNHRVQAYRLAKGTDALIPVDVIDGLTIEQEASLFSQQNKRRNLNSQQTHIARVAGGDPLHVFMDELLSEHGLSAHIKGPSSSQADRRFSGLATLREIVIQGGPTHARECVGIAVAGFRREGKQIPVMAMAGISQLLIKFGDRVDRERLIRVCNSLDVAQIGAQAESLKSIVGRAARDAWGIVLHGAYNRKTTSGRIPEWDSVDAVEFRRRAEALRSRDEVVW